MGRWIQGEIAKVWQCLFPCRTWDEKWTLKLITSNYKLHIQLKHTKITYIQVPFICPLYSRYIISNIYIYIYIYTCTIYILYITIYIYCLVGSYIARLPRNLKKPPQATRCPRRFTPSFRGFLNMSAVISTTRSAKKYSLPGIEGMKQKISSIHHPSLPLSGRFGGNKIWINKNPTHPANSYFLKGRSFSISLVFPGEIVE